MDDTWIDRYLLNELTDEERSSFEEMIESDPILQQKVEEQRLLIDSLRRYSSYHLKSKLKETESKIQGQNNSKFAWVKYLGIFLFIAVLVCVIVYWTSEKKRKLQWQDSKPLQKDTSSLPLQIAHKEENAINPKADDQNEKVNSKAINFEELYADNFSVYKDEFLETDSRGLAEKSAHDLFCESYLKAEFQTALNFFDKMDPSLQENRNILFFKGIAYMKLHQFDRAILIFEGILKNGQCRYSDEILWYSALCYIKKKDAAKAKAFLSKKELERDPRAIELIKKLN